MSIWWKAILSSALVALLLTIALTAVSNRMFVHSPDIDPNQLEALNYFEGHRLLREQTIRGWAAFWKNLGDPFIWESLLISWTLTFVACLAACALLIKWSTNKPQKTPPAG